MCTAKKPKVQAAPPMPPPQTVVTEDAAAMAERARERRRQGSRQGRTSTILAGDTSSMVPTTQVKTVLGA